PNWVDAYFKINDNLRRCDLTINIRSTSWFRTPNSYRDYTQMYQRNTNKETGETVLKDDDLNPAVIRVAIDDGVTLSPSWSDAMFGPKKKVYSAMSFGGSALPEDAESHMRDDAKAYAKYHGFQKSQKST